MHWVATHFFHVFNVWLLLVLILSGVVAFATSFVEVFMLFKLNDRLPKEERFPEMFYHRRWIAFNRAYKAMFGGDRLFVTRNVLYTLSILLWIVSGAVFLWNLLHRFHGLMGR
ncbi:MAG TPA: hypothetical protein VGS02_04970 [Acidobacteriaceae bacterium]|nr:hypothetical protein [Acidobacteriaceae bacterium]